MTSLQQWLTRSDTLTSPVGRVMRWVPALLIAILGIVAACHSATNHDVASFMVLCARLLAGDGLYRDVIDSSTPMAFWLYSIPTFIADHWQLSRGATVDACIFFLIGISGVASWRCICQQPLLRDRAGTVLAALAFGLIYLPHMAAMDFAWGQREHLLAILITPYIFLALNRLQHIAASRAAAVMVGVLACIGFCLKPHFLLMFGVSELFLLWQLGWRMLPTRPEPWVIGLGSLLYYGVLGLWFPEYVTVLLPLFSQLRAGYTASMAEVVLHSIRWFVLPLLCLLTAHRMAAPTTVRYLALLAMAGAALTVLQPFNFFYHAFPAQYFILLLVTLGLLVRQPFIIAYAALTLGFIGMEGLGYDLDFRMLKEATSQQHTILVGAQKITHYAKGGPVAAFDTTVMPMQAVNEARAPWALPLPLLMQLPAMYAQTPAHYRRPEDMPSAERFFFDKTVAAMLAQKPSLVLVNKRMISSQTKPYMAFDYVAYFNTDPRFADLWKSYRLAEDDGTYLFYVREE